MAGKNKVYFPRRGKEIFAGGKFREGLDSKMGVCWARKKGAPFQGEPFWGHKGKENGENPGDVFSAVRRGRPLLTP